MRKLSVFLVALLLAGSATAQTVQQTGTVTAGHAVRWVGNGLVGDAGTAANGFITSLGVVNNGGPGVCVQSAASTASGYNQLCLAASTAAAAQISLQNYGAATAQNLQFNINGTIITLPTGGGTTIPSITTPLVNNDLICASGTTGALVGCTMGTAGQLLVGQGSTTAPAWKTMNGDVASIDINGNFTVGKVNGVAYPASPTIGMAPYVSSANTVTYGVIPATAGGTGVNSPTAHGVVIAQGASPVTSVTSNNIGQCLLSQGAGSDPIFGSCASGSGSAAGSNTQVQFNNSTALAGSANLTWVSPALTIGVNASATGQLVLANGGALGTSVTIQNLGTTSAWNFNLPTGAGTSGQPLISGGGGAASMTFGTLGVGGGGTNCASPSGTCVDNISGFSSTGFINRTGAGTYAFTTTIGLLNGGTGANLTASNGGIVYSTASAMAILSGTATANQVLLSGSSTAPTWSTATYPATTTQNQILYSSALNTITGLATANNGVLITSGAGAPSISSTLPSAVQGNITATGTIASGVWNGTAIDLAHGGTNANLTASNGGIFYSTASAGAILAGTATANMPLLSGSSTTPSWASITYPASATSGGILYFSSSTAMASSGVMGSGQIVLGGGAGASPTTSANASISSGQLTLGQSGSVLGSVVLNGSTSGAVTVKAAAAAGTSTNFQLPNTNGTSGQVLQTDGSGNTSWTSVAGTGTVTSVAAGTGMSFATITTSGSVAIDGATAGNFEAGTTNKVLTADVVFTSETTTTFSTTPTFDFSTFFNTKITLTSNITSVTCSNIKAGQSGTIRFIQDATGSRTLAGMCSAFKFANGTAPVLTTTASAVDAMVYSCSATTYCVASLIKNVQ